MNEKFVPPMTRKYNTALSVNEKLLNFKDLSLHSRKSYNDDFNMRWRQISQQISLFKENIHLFNDVIHVYS